MLRERWSAGKVRDRPPPTQAASKTFNEILEEIVIFNVVILHYNRESSSIFPSTHHVLSHDGESSFTLIEYMKIHKMQIRGNTTQL